MRTLEETINYSRANAASSMILHKQMKIKNDKERADFFREIAENQMQIADWLTDYNRLLGEHNAKNEDICVLCGEIIPEESMPYPNCETPHWISCKERMPEKDTIVIVASNGSDLIIPEDGETITDAIRRLNREIVRVTIGFIGSDGWYDCEFTPMMVQPSYWMPLPEPPERDDE